MFLAGLNPCLAQQLKSVAGFALPVTSGRVGPMAKWNLSTLLAGILGGWSCLWSVA